jgi:hypothetical protein
MKNVHDECNMKRPVGQSISECAKEKDFHLNNIYETQPKPKLNKCK